MEVPTIAHVDPRVTDLHHGLLGTEYWPYATMVENLSTNVTV